MPTLLRITVTPTSVLMGQSITFVVEGTFDDGSTADVTSSTVFARVSETPSLAATGLDLVSFSAPSVASTPKASTVLNGGSAVLSATVAGVVSDFTLTVTPLTITALAFDSSSLTIPFNQTLPIARLSATFNDGTTAYVNNQSLFPITWASSDTTVVQLTDARGSLYLVKSGTSILSATFGSISVFTNLMVSPSLVGLTANVPAHSYIGTSVQLVVLAAFNDGTSSDVTTATEFTISNPSVVSISSTGWLTLVGSGSTSITCTYQGLSTVHAIAVPSLLTSTLVVARTAVVGNLVKAAYIDSYSDGTEQDLSGSVNWFSSNNAVATVDQNGSITCLATGSVVITGIETDVAVCTSTLTISPATLVGIVITAPSGTVAVGKTLQLTATGQYSGGTEQDITATVTWSFTSLAASVSKQGVVLTQAPGLAILIATQDKIQASFSLNVFPAVDPNVVPAFRSHLTQTMLNYFDPTDTRVREGKYTLDAQLLNIAAQAIEMSDLRMTKELRSTTLASCPAHLDNRGVYLRQALPASFDFTKDHLISGVVDGNLVPLTPYDESLPIPSRVLVDETFTPVAMEDPVIFRLQGIGVENLQSWAVQRVKSPVMVMTGRLVLVFSGQSFSQMNLRVRITGQRAPAPAWANCQVQTSETIRITELGTARSKFAWASISEIQVSGLPVNCSLSGQVGTFGLAALLDQDRPYTDPATRDVSYKRYWTYSNGLLTEQYLASNYQGYRYVQSYATGPVAGFAIEPNTYGMFVAQGTTLSYIDRREPMPTNLQATALTAEPYYGLDVMIDETYPGPLRYVILRPVPYINAGQVNQYRYRIELPDGNAYILTPDGVLATYIAATGWRRGAPVPLTIPLAQLGTYVITLECSGNGNVVLADSVPYPNLGMNTLALFDLSAIVPSISGLSFDDRGRLWVWSGDYAIALELHYDSYLLDADSQSLYLTDLVTRLAIDGVTI